jgi:perosamine synthetase
MGFIAPAGTPIGATDLVMGLGAGLLGQEAHKQFAALLALHSGSDHSWLMSSGRAAMSLALEAMKRISDPRRRQVLVAGYTCYSVPAAVERAGLEIRLCDIDPRTLSIRTDDLQRFDPSRVLCVVSANLYGMPNTLHELEQFAVSNGIFMLDDAAQSLGARLQGRPVGGFGDIGLYSFDKGKNITTMQGGALVSSNASLAPQITGILDQWPAPSASSTLAHAAKLAIYGLLLKPSLYGVTQKLPFLGLGRTPYEPTCPQTQLGDCLSGLGLRLARQLDDINRIRQQNAIRLRESLKDLPGIELIDAVPGGECVYSRFPIRVDDASVRDALIDSFRAAGIGATCSYPNALADVPALSGKLHSDDLLQRGSRDIARTIVTLPTHAYCPSNLGEQARQIIAKAVAR